MTKRQMAEEAKKILGETRQVYMDDERAEELARRIVDRLYDSLIEEKEP
jgi:hypothetical protein